MHRLQLSIRTRVCLGLACLVALGWVAAAKVNFRVVDASSPELALAAFGFRHRGKEFTGVIYRTTRRGGIARVAFVFGGLRHGPDIQWHPNGERWVHRRYRSGVEHGIQRAWYENGRPQMFKTFNKGTPVGESFEWYPDGQLSSYIAYDKGQERVARTWTGKGFPFFNYAMVHGERAGILGDRLCSVTK